MSQHIESVSADNSFSSTSQNVFGFDDATMEQYIAWCNEDDRRMAQAEADAEFVRLSEAADTYAAELAVEEAADRLYSQQSASRARLQSAAAIGLAAAMILTGKAGA